MKQDKKGDFMEKILNYTVWFYSAKGGNLTQVPNTGQMTAREANSLAHDLRINNMGRMQLAVYRGNDLCSCFALSDSMKPVITV